MSKTNSRQPLIDFDEAVARAVAAVTPLETEWLSVESDPVLLRNRALAEDVHAQLIQPPGPVSAMDGYAVRAEDLPGELKVIGESAAGHPFDGEVSAGECVRIFTGALVPQGADTIAIQENCETIADGRIRSEEPVHKARFVRPKGMDFDLGARLVKGSRVTARTLALAAAMDNPTISVHRRPRVAILSTGDELKRAGEPREPGDIVSSNHITLANLISEAGGEPVVLPTARDEMEEVKSRLKQVANYDLAIISGGASVGDHDLVRPALLELNAEMDFWKIAMRPGKPLLFASLDGTPVLGLPGNPVSTYITGLMFAVPMVKRMLGLEYHGLRKASAVLSKPLDENDIRREFMRAVLSPDGTVAPVDSQESSLLSRLGTANCFIDRAAFAKPSLVGELVTILLLDD